MNIVQRTFLGTVAATLAFGLSCTSLQAAHSKAGDVGKYTTRVQEARLFVDGGTRLRCDLFFSTPCGDVAVAKKDSLIAQQLPAFVWQYSGLLPVSDFLKTVAIHSVATDQKIERWQDVQRTFYDGLRAEGVAEADAKIAFAGAYAFAPRWPLIELVEVPDEQNIPDTILYSVTATGPATKGLSVDDYRAMARDILDNPQDVTLQDIRGIIDVVDAGEGGYEESGLLIKVMNKIKDATSAADDSAADDSAADDSAAAVAKKSLAGESIVVDGEPVMQNADKSGVLEDDRSDEWVAMPDGTAVLREVANLAQKSSVKL